MVEVCAAMGLTNLEALTDVFARNHLNYRDYQSALSEVPGVAMLVYEETDQNSRHYIVIEVRDGAITRDRAVAALHAENVLARRYFWPGCHQMKPYSDLYPHAGAMLTQSQWVADRVVVLPTGPAVCTEDIKTIAAVIKSITTS
jgi:dTDP-4-amino-4,6-dideoxygalactose transaminase